MKAARPVPHPHATQVFLVFLRLGLVAFGGPIAHLGYFRKEFVERRRWLDDAAYADLLVVTICALGGALLGAWF
jgi:chromate transporter